MMNKAIKFGLIGFLLYIFYTNYKKQTKQQQKQQIEEINNTPPTKLYENQVNPIYSIPNTAITSVVNTIAGALPKETHQMLKDTYTPPKKAKHYLTGSHYTNSRIHY
jgi:hypothetical protein